MWHFWPNLGIPAIRCAKKGPTGITANKSISATFKLLLTPEVVIIVRQTNRRSNQSYQLWNAEHPVVPQRKYEHFRDLWSPKWTSNISRDDGSKPLSTDYKVHALRQWKYTWTAYTCWQGCCYYRYLVDAKQKFESMLCCWWFCYSWRATNTHTEANTIQTSEI